MSEKKDFVMKDAAGGTASPDASGDACDRAMLPEINFSTFLFSLNASALVHLGAMPDPSTGQTGKNLDLGKQTIDIIAMLEEKTSGNLTNDEEQLLKNTLYDLRMRYIREKGC
jgi:hypothetical protein